MKLLQALRSSRPLLKQFGAQVLLRTAAFAMHDWALVIAACVGRM